MMFENFWHKKEKPFAGFGGFGGGAASLSIGGAGGFEASGGIISEYTDPGGTYRSHVFTASGSLVVASGEATVEYFVLGGGGGGGTGSGGGGGGAGGFRTNMTGHPNAPSNPQTFTAATGSYAIVVGKGGDGAHRNPIVGKGQNGSDSTLAVSPTVTVTSTGGGGGGSEGGGYQPGANGASGGGGAYTGPGGEATASGAEGNDGGAGASAPNYTGGGGGGAGGSGGDAGPSGEGGEGGVGLQCLIAGPANDLGVPGPSGISWFAGGGGAGSQDGAGPGTAGGATCGGGVGGAYDATPPYGGGKGRDGTGAGGGGVSPSAPAGTTNNAGTTSSGPRSYSGTGPGVPGGYGIVVCRYAIDALGGTAKATGGSVSYYSGKVIHAFTNPGDFNVTSTIPSAEVVVIGGGGGGGWGALGDGGSGGGGAGAVLIHPAMPFGTGPNAVVIGEGGLGASFNQASPEHNAKEGMNGENTTFGGLVALGGGYGNGQEGYPGGANPGGGDGGSGGGGSGGGSPGPGPAGDDTSPPASTGATVYGNPGSGGGGASTYFGGGGGGAGGNGSVGSGSEGGEGGVGIQLPATFRDPLSGLGDPGTYGGSTAPTPGGFWVGGGGGAGKYSAPQTVGEGGSGGGGQGYGATSTDRDDRPQGTDGMRGTGGGGGGVNYGSTTPYMMGQAGQGGPGIVLIAYPE